MRLTADQRGVSPVIGAVLLLGILVIGASVAAYMFFGIGGPSNPAPATSFEVIESEDGNEYLIKHTGGDTIDGSQIEVSGAANETIATGKTITSGDSLTVYPVEEEISIIWMGDRDTSYELETATVEQAYPEPDVACDWVAEQSDNGTDSVTIDGSVVNCEVGTEEMITVRDGGVVVGDIESELKELDLDAGTVHGSVTVTKVANIQGGTIEGPITSETADAKVADSEVDGSVTAEKVAEITAGSSVNGNVTSRIKDVKILNSEVTGSVTAEGLIKLQNATVTGDVYSTQGDYDCSDSTINGQSCEEYAKTST